MILNLCHRLHSDSLRTSSSRSEDLIFITSNQKKFMNFYTHLVLVAIIFFYYIMEIIYKLRKVGINAEAPVGFKGEGHIDPLINILSFLTSRCLFLISSPSLSVIHLSDIFRTCLVQEKVRPRDYNRHIYTFSSSLSHHKLISTTTWSTFLY